MKIISNFLEESFYFPIFLAIVGIVLCGKSFIGKQKMAFYWVLSVAVISMIARGLYITFASGIYSFRYFLPGFLIILLFATIGVAFSVRKYDSIQKQKIIWLILLSSYIIGSIANVALHGLSRKKYFNSVKNDLVIYADQHDSKQKIALVTNIADKRLQVPEEYELYCIKNLPYEDLILLLYQVRLNHDQILFLDKVDSKKLMSNNISWCPNNFNLSEIQLLSQYEEKRNTIALYQVKYNQNFTENGTKEFDLIELAPTFNIPQLWPAKIKRMQQHNLPVESMKNFLLPPKWSVDECNGWSSTSLPIDSRIIYENSIPTWNIVTAGNVSIIRSIFMPADGKIFKLTVDISGLSTDAKFKPALISDGGYKYFHSLQWNSSIKYTYLMSIPANQRKDKTIRFGFIAYGNVKICDIRLEIIDREYENIVHDR